MKTKNLPLATELVPIDKISIPFFNLSDTAVSVLEKIHYKNLVVSFGQFKETGHFDVTLVLFNRLDLEIPGTGGMSLVLNPSLNQLNGGSSDISVTLDYRWDILKYRNSFSFASFNESIEQIFDFILEIGNIRKEDFFINFLSEFFGNADFIDDFVDHFNSISTGGNFQLSLDTNITDIFDQIDHIIQQFESNGTNIFEDLFQKYIKQISFDDTINRLNAIFQETFKGITLEKIKKFISLSASFSINDITVALEFPRNVLRPVFTGFSNYPDAPTDSILNEALPEPFKSQLKFDVGSISYSTQDGLTFNNLGNFDFGKSYIGNTSITLEFENLKLDFSRKTNIVEANTDGRPNDFIGMFVETATIGLPAKWFKQSTGATLGIFGEKLLIGTGGISGTIGLKAIGGGVPATDAELAFELGSKLKMGFSKFDLVFEKGKITASDIAGSITVNLHNTPTKIGVKMHFEEDGDFSITASNKAGVNLPFGQAFSFTMRELEVGKEDSKLYLSTTGDLIFPETSPVYKILELKEPIPINKLKIWEDGHVELDGGSIQLPKAITANLGPAKISITAIHMGSYEKGGRKYKYIGFDGGVNVNPGGVDVRGTGLKFYYTVDGGAFDSFISIDSIAIDLIIPGSATKETASVLIQGWLSVQGDEYMGGVALQLPKLNMAGNVDMRFDTKYPAWIVDAGFEFPAPIPLAATGLGIYGFRGLVGQRYVASKTAAGLTERDTWFDYYKAKTPLHQTQGINVEKFAKPEGTKTAKSPFSVGAGATIATLAKDGDVFSTKLFLLLSLPSVVYLEGKATILDKRLGLNDNDPPFFAVVAFEPRKSVVFNLGTQYQIGDQGRILDMYAEIGAGYYFDNPAAWYINFGTKDKPMQAKVLSLFQAKAYLMINRSGIEAGARVDWGFNKSYLGGSVSASVNVYIEVGGHISFLRPQIGAYASLGGNVDVSLFGFGIGVGINATLEVEVPKPFLIRGAVDVSVYVKFLGKKIGKSFTVEFRWDKEQAAAATAIIPLPTETGRLQQIAKAVNIKSNETFTLVASISEPTKDTNLDSAIIPLDSYIDVQLEKGVRQTEAVKAILGGMSPAPVYDDYTEILPPQPINFSETHSYTLENLEIKMLNGEGKWVDYNPYRALATPDELIMFDAQAENYKAGYWQKKGTKYDNFRILSQNSFTYMDQGQPGWFVPEKFGLTASTLFCKSRTIEKTCVNWTDEAVDKLFTAKQSYYKKGVNYILSQGGKTLNYINSSGINQSLVFEKGQLELFLPETSAYIELRLFTYSTGVIVKYYAGTPGDYQLVESRTINRSELAGVVTYNPSDKKGVDRITIQKVEGDLAVFTALRTEVNQAVRWVRETNGLTPLQLTEHTNFVTPRRAQMAAISAVGSIVTETEFDCAAINAKMDSEIARVQQLKDTVTVELTTLTERYTTYKTQYDSLNKKHTTCFKEMCAYQLPKAALSCLQEMSLLPPPTGASDLAYETFMEDVQKFVDDLHISSIAYFINMKKVCRDLSNHLTQLNNTIVDIEVQISNKQTEITRYTKQLADLTVYKATHNCTGYIRPNGFGHDGTFVHQICYLTVKETMTNERRPSQAAIQEEYTAMVSSMEHSLSPIWRPDTKYYISATVSDSVQGGAPQSQTVYFSFQTKGPLGHWHKEETIKHSYLGITLEEEANKTPAEKEEILRSKSSLKQLTSLKSYIDFGKSYPNADGNIILAKPLFYDKPNLNLFYTERYVYYFFNDWPSYNNAGEIKSSLQVVIKDPVEDISFVNPPVNESGFSDVEPPLFPIVKTLNWKKDLSAHKINSVAALSNMSNPALSNKDFIGTICVETGGKPIQPVYLTTKIEPTVLKPLKLYTAIFNNLYKGVPSEVHRYVFQTSRYADFNEQVNSYRLKDSDGNVRDAIFGITLAANVDVELARRIVNRDSISGNATQKALSEKYSQEFDQLIFGALGLSPLDAPISTEFNTVRSHNGDLIGIWVRNPEPFNDPKLLTDPKAVNEIKDILTVSRNRSYRVLWSNDLSQAFIMKNAGIIPENKSPKRTYLNFTFKLKSWNGKEYVNESVQVDKIEVSITRQ